MKHMTQLEIHKKRRKRSKLLLGLLLNAFIFLLIITGDIAWFLLNDVPETTTSDTASEKKAEIKNLIIERELQL